MSRPVSAPTLPPPFPRHLAVIILLCMGCAFAGNHVAARVAFDDGAGVLLAILLRSGGTLLVLAILVLWQRQSLRLPAGAWRWQLLLGLLITAQSLCLYSAVARVPVAVALLVANVFPILLALLTWATGGPRPTARTAALMALILLGLVFVLDVPGRLSNHDRRQCALVTGHCARVLRRQRVCLRAVDHRPQVVSGTWLGAQSADHFHRLQQRQPGGLTGALPGGLNLPATSTGWLALATLVVLYGTGFIVLFISVPRFDMPRNAPVMNIEPLATLLMGWMVLDQMLSAGQILGRSDCGHRHRIADVS
jgi:drug/metabolite transporter (DMT)-like permease